jgi:mono/diheme cytochrome c family protein
MQIRYDPTLVDAVVSALIQEREATGDPRSAGLLALGKKFYTEAGCFDCHGTSGKGDGPAAATLKDEWGYPIVPYDFTLPGRMKGGSSVRDIYRTLQVGIGGTPMPSYGDSLTEEETWALAYYTLSLAKRPLTEPAPSRPGTVVSKFRKGDLPVDPLAAVWTNVPFVRVHLVPLWVRKQPVEEVRVKSLHNGQQIAFLLEWDDPIVNQDVLRSQDFRDAAAVQFPVMSVELHGAGHAEPSFTMGDQHGPVNIWHWKADWEADLQRHRDVQDRYAGMAVDLYPQTRGLSPKEEPTAQVMTPLPVQDATYVTGWGAGNPLSIPNRPSSVEDLNAIGFGTLTSQPREDQNVQGRGIWNAGKWRVIMVRTMRSQSDRDVQFVPGHSLPIAFAVWDGAQGDRDGQKAVSVWQQLNIETAR